MKESVTTGPHPAAQAVPPYLRVIDDFATAAECDALRERYLNSNEKRLQPVTLPNGVVHRTTHETSFFDEAVAHQFALRLGRSVVPDRVNGWHLSGLSPVFRIFHHPQGAFFGEHEDGPSMRAPADVSFFTFLLYLETTKSGGETCFTTGERVEAKKGRLLLFNHCRMHWGARVEVGEKFTLRSDVFFRDVKALVALDDD